MSNDAGHAIKLTLLCGAQVRSDKHAGYVAAIDLLRRSGAVGTTVLLAVDGALQGARQRARFFTGKGRAPLMLVAVGDARSLRAALPALPDLLDSPIATIERVQVCKSNGIRLSEPRVAVETDPSGLPIWHKLVIDAEQQAKADGHPLHRALVRRLREAGSSGATVLRGLRGFYADHEPFADRMLQLRRNAPVHAVVLDTPENMRRWWPIVDELTREAGLVTSERVPATHAFAGERERELKLAAIRAPAEQRREQ